MSYPRPHRLDGSVSSEIRELFSEDLSRPVVIVGNGPSAAVPRHAELPDDPIVFRMNWFFLEDRYHFGRTVDGYFFSIPNEELERRLGQVIREGWYDVRAVFSPMRMGAGRIGERYRSEFHETGTPEFDHWSVLADDPVVSRFMMSRPLPTQGMQVLATALAAGFRDITLCGIDMYEPGSSRYGYAVPESVVASLQPKDLAPGYESLHSLDRDLDFLDACLLRYPDAKISYLGQSAHLTSRLPPPAIRPRRCTFNGADAAEIQIQPKPTFEFDPTTGRESTFAGISLPHKLIDGRRCGFVTLVSGDTFHHGARALARSLAAVTDVPLTVMCTPSANRGALLSSGIACVDVPEIQNPNTLVGPSQRFASTYTKLNAFRMTHLDRAVYIDSDMVVLRSIDDLFERDGFCAVYDHGIEHCYDRFNSGLFKYDPDARLFEMLVSRTASVESYDSGDQGFLNEIFKDWIRLPHEYNVSKRWSNHHPNLFRLSTTRVLHFVGTKPWQHEDRSAYDELYRLWFTFLTRNELVDVADALRRIEPSTLKARGGRWLRFRRRAIFSQRATAGGERPEWSHASLLERVRARQRAGAFSEADELLEREWPGDNAASPAMWRERARSRILAGQVELGIRSLQEGEQRFPGQQGIASLKRKVERFSMAQRLTLRLVPDSALTWILRIYVRR